MNKNPTNLSDRARNLEKLDHSQPEEDPTGPSDSDPIRDPDMDIDVEVDVLNPSDDEGCRSDVEEDDFETPDGRIYTPPPRIAARFYRPSAARRKGSAASSRRNSISSAHSISSRGGEHPHHHHPRDRGGPQSKHIAQHLRRAHFLEDRRARLADRAAHAEKVRLRAALAKAAPRNTTASEERAAAAHLARRKNLDEIAASCAADVRRAKAVAENMKEKREQEAERLRVQMQERMAEADRRREQLRKKRGRAQSTTATRNKDFEVLPQVKEQDSDPESETTATARTRPQGKTVVSPETAAGRIQLWWRAQARRKAITEFADLGLSIEGVRETSFETVVEMLAKEKVLASTARCLRLCGLQEGDTGSVNEMAAVRTFLSAFLILGHPAQVLSSKNEQGDQEQDLVTKASDLLITFENTLSRLTAFNNYTPPPALFETLSESYASFHNAFIAWKARDSNTLVEVMIMQFVELDAIWHTVRDSPEDSVTTSYRESIKENQLLLIVRIKKLVGREKGKQMIKTALDQARRTRAAKKPKGDMKPRNTEQAEVDAEDPGIDEDGKNASSSGQGQRKTQPTETNQTKSTPQEQARRQQSQQQSQRQQTSPDAHGFQGVIPDNRILMHELAINKEYSIDPSSYRRQASAFISPLFREMRKIIDTTTPTPASDPTTASAAVAAAQLEENLQNREAQFRFLILMSQYVKSKLQRLVKPGHNMHNLIGEILDEEVMQRQFIAGSFSYERFFDAMASLLPKLCAPVRDVEVKKLVEVGGGLRIGHVVDRVERLVGFIDVMLSDYANYLLRLSAPKLLEQAAGYERRIFGGLVDRAEFGPDGLVMAKEAWKHARGKMMEEAGRRDPEGVNHPRGRPTAERIYSQMLVDVFMGRLSGPRGAGELPEMLRLDFERVGRVRAVVGRIIATGTVLLQCKSLLKRDTRRPWKTEASRVMAVLEGLEKEEERIKEEEEDERREREGGRPLAFGLGVGPVIQQQPLPPTPEELAKKEKERLEKDEALISSTTDSILSALEAGRAMPVATRTKLRSAALKVVQEMAVHRKQHTEPTQGPLRILLLRLRSHVLARLCVVGASERVRLTGAAGERLASIGLPEFVEGVREIVEEVGRVGSVDREAHGGWWEGIGTRVEAEEAEGTGQ